jgi:heme oxygenase
MTTTTGWDPRAILRAATGSRHENLDSSLRLAAPRAGYDDYIAYLVALSGWMQPVERAMLERPWPAALQAGRRAGKCEWILDDLRAARSAGLSVPPGATCGDLPNLRGSDSYALGVLYVIEGSQLGGRFMAKRFAHAFPDRDFVYLAGYGDETGALWKSFLDFMTAQLATRAQADEAARGACDAFDTLGRWLTGCGQFIADRGWKDYAAAQADTGA